VTGEILDNGLATVLFGDDVIHLMRRCSKFLVEANNTHSNSRPLDSLPAQTQPWGAWSYALFLEHTGFEEAYQMLEAFKRVKFLPSLPAVNVPSDFSRG